jgi:hypothetical protein
MTREVLEHLSKLPTWCILAGPVKHTSRILVAILRPIGARPVHVGQHGGRNTKGYCVGHLAPAFAKYLD